MEDAGSWWRGAAAGAALACAAVLLLVGVLSLPCVRGRRGRWALGGRVIVVTGAANGLGLELCRQVAEQEDGCELCMVDIDTERLQAAAAAVGVVGAPRGTTARAVVCDVSDAAALQAACEGLARDAAARGKYVSVLVNNACRVRGKGWEELPPEELEATLRLGVVAHLVAARAFLPGMRLANDGMVVTMSSLMGLMPGCKLIDYCAAKYAAQGLHESLQLELERTPGNQVHMLCVCPYAVDTGMFAGAFMEPKLWLTRALFPFLRPADVVARVLAAMRAREYVVVVPWVLTLVPFLLRLLPVPVWRWALEFGGASSGMDTFQGRASRSGAASERKRTRPERARKDLTAHS